MPKIEIVGEIGWDITAEEFKNKLKGMSGDLEVEISTPGGSIYQGIAIFNELMKYDGHITTVNTGMAASMGSYLMLAGDTVKAYDNATYMIHNGWTFAWGDHRKLRKTADHVEQLSAIICKKYMEKTGKDEAELRQMMDDVTYLYGHEMLEHGFVDEIISTDRSKDKDSALASFKASIQQCAMDSKGHCKQEGYSGDIEAALASMPTVPQADKLEKNSNTRGDEMPKEITQDDLDAVQAKLDAANTAKDQLNDQMASLRKDADEYKAAISEKDERIKTLTEGADAKHTLTKEIVAMAFEHGVPKETALAMLDKGSVPEAGMMVLGEKRSSGQTSQANDLDDGDEAASEDAEMSFALKVAQAISVKK